MYRMKSMGVRVPSLQAGVIQPLLEASLLPQIILAICGSEANEGTG